MNFTDMVVGLLAQGSRGGFAGYRLAGILIAIVVVSYLLGNFIAKRLRMPMHGSRIGLMIGSIALAIFFFSPRQNEEGKWVWPMTYGVDLRGGTILIYELADIPELPQQTDDQKSEQDIEQVKKGKSKELIGALTERLNPSGTNEIVIRPYGDNQLEIIVPNTDPREVEEVKSKIDQAGVLRFAIVANQRDHRALIEEARRRSESDDPILKRSKEIRNEANQLIGIWALVDRESADVDPKRPLRVDIGNDILRDTASQQIVQPGPLDRYALVGWMEDQKIPGLEVLMAISPELDVTGEDLAFVTSSMDETGAPAVDFGIKDSAQSKFGVLTRENSPEGSFFRRLGIVLDGRLKSAPQINSEIRSRGQITGRFTRKEVDFLTSILRSGSLPASLVKTPVAENQIGSTLGADTINKGTIAIAISIVAVMVFMLVYYRFLGLIACLALAANILLIMGIMVLFKVPLTLPGLAGLVLTVGMAVDANVLIFERIREEREKGAAARMAVRNGFSRAMTTIIDSNLTTMLTGIVLYVIGTDTVRGFAATLILGIVFSLVTAIYFGRTYFDISERKGWLRLGMSNLMVKIRDAIGGPDGIDFMGKAKLCFAISGTLIVVGLAAAFLRGREMLDIDFNGGSTATFQLREAKSVDEMRLLVDKVFNSDPNAPRVATTLNQFFVKGTTGAAQFKLDTSLTSLKELKERLQKGLVDSSGKSLLVSYVATIRKPDPEEIKTGFLPEVKERLPKGLVIRPVAFRVAQEGAVEGKKEEPSVDEAKPEQGSTSGSAAANSTEENLPTARPLAPNEKIVVSQTTFLSLSTQDASLPAKMTSSGLIAAIIKAGKTAGIDLNESVIHLTPIGEGAEDWRETSNLQFSDWKIQLDMSAQQADQLIAEFKRQIEADPVFLSSGEIGTRVAEGMQLQAIAATLFSMLGIVAYVWFRFHRFIWGIAAVVAIIHDVLVTIGALAISHWLAGPLGFLMIDDFKISLTVVAALLTIVGYSINDTIVVFDRIREARGKSPHLTSEMVNRSLNQTLGRTLLTSITTLLVVLILYVLGGESIHAFAFSLLVGITVGTYSSIFIAAPIVLWKGVEDDVGEIRKASPAA